MSNTDEQFDPEDYEGVQERMATLPRREVRRFEKERRELAAERERSARLERENAFIRAGILDIEAPKYMYFVRGYDGEMDPDAIKAAAVEAGLMNEGAPVTDAEAQGHEVMARVANGAGNVNLEDDISRQLREVRQNIHWRDGDQAQAEIMRIVGANDIKYYPGAVPGA